jgi:hypothetical protein
MEWILYSLWDRALGALRLYWIFYCKLVGDLGKFMSCFVWMTLLWDFRFLQCSEFLFKAFRDYKVITQESWKFQIKAHRKAHWTHTKNKTIFMDKHNEFKKMLTIIVSRKKNCYDKILWKTFPNSVIMRLFGEKLLFNYHDIIVMGKRWNSENFYCLCCTSFMCLFLCGAWLWVESDGFEWLLNCLSE